MNNFLKTFEILLRKVILPKFPRISDVKVEYKGFHREDIQVTYYTDYKFDILFENNLYHETYGLLDMMGLDKRPYLWVNYKSVNKSDN